MAKTTIFLYLKKEILENIYVALIWQNNEDNQNTKNQALQ